MFGALAKLLGLKSQPSNSPRLPAKALPKLDNPANPGNLPSPLDQLLTPTPDQQLNAVPTSHGSNILQGMVFGNNAHNPGHGVPLLTSQPSNLNDWQFYSNTSNPNSQGWLENGAGQRIPYGGAGANVKNPSIALPYYMPPKQPQPIQVRTT